MTKNKKRVRQVWDYQPCDRLDGERTRQLYVGATKVNGQAFDRYRCDCGEGRPHQNLIVRVSQNDVWAVAEYNASALNGRSIFGQKLYSVGQD